MASESRKGSWCCELESIYQLDGEKRRKGAYELIVPEVSRRTLNMSCKQLQIKSDKEVVNEPEGCRIRAGLKR